MARNQQAAPNVSLPDIKPGERKKLLGPEIGTQFDIGQRLFAFFGGGDVFLPLTMVSGRPAT